jgi:hypothetical protein
MGMQTKLLAKATAAAFLGVLLALYIQHDLLKWNALGRSAFLSYQNHRFDTSMAYPRSELSLVLHAIFLALVVTGLYELMVAGITKLIRPAR